MLNLGRVEELREEMGDDALPEVIELFLEETGEVVGRLQAGPDPDALEEDMHFLKGAAMNLGFDHMAELCATAEAQAGGRQPGDPAVPPILVEFETARGELMSHARNQGWIS